jgi:cytochrome c oxidase subunit II
MSDLLRRLLNLPPEASSIAASIDALHFFVIAVTMLGWLAVTVAAITFIIRYRRRHGETRPQAGAPAPRGFELGVVVGLLGLFLLWWVIGYVEYLKIREPPKDAMEVYGVGKQWMWKFSYPDGRSSIGILTVPAGRPVKLFLTSRDVIHGFYVPAFRIKQDVLPGRYTTAWFQVDEPGTYQIMCTQYCGLLHSNMWGSVVALSPADYEKWLQRTEPAESGASEEGAGLAEEAVPGGLARTGVTLGLAARGREVAARYACFNCHTIDGRVHIGPTWKDLYHSRVPLEGGGEVRADEAYLTESMMDPRAKIVRGFTPVMPSYQGVLEPADVAALVEYIKSLALPNVAPKPAIPVWTGKPPEEVQ